MAKKVRVYELARELGLDNAETLALCESLGIGVKSASSSMEEAHADRARRKADREGLRREPIVDDEPEDKPAEAPKSVISTRKPPPRRVPPPPGSAAPRRPAPDRPPQRPVGQAAPVPTTPPPGPRPTPAPAAPAQAPAAPAAQAPAAPAPAAPAPAPVAQAPAAPTAATPTAATPPPAAPPAVPTVPAAPVPTSPPPGGAPPKRVVTSSGSSGPSRPPAAAPPAAAPPAKPAAPTAEAKPAAPGGESKPGPKGKDAGPRRPDPSSVPRSASGKPIPPPPGPPKSASGKPIPPPPGLGGRGPAPANRPGGRPGGFSRPGGGGGAPRPGGGGAPAPGGGPPRPGGGRPGGPGGRGNNRRPPRRRSRRRRRSLEELRPVDVPTYTPEGAPVPSGTIMIERNGSAQEVGPKLDRTGADIVRFLLQSGEMVMATQTLTDEQVLGFAESIGADVRLVDPGEEREEEMRDMLDVDDLDEREGVTRPPVITIMGHVDHGKTKLLDTIRNANVVAGEAGGITQHIGAYMVERDSGALTFIDTPGHAAFTTIRARGAEATDIVVLVVAADDGVMPQTIEAINHAKAADVPIIVAINKMDREAANPDRVMNGLSEQGLVPEEWGGDTVMVKISALQNDNIDALLDAIQLVAEVEELTAPATGRAAGVVLESNIEVGKGPVATILVQQGQVEVGQPLVAGGTWGRVRALINDRGERIKIAGPSMPVQVLGLSDVPRAGDEFVIAQDEKTAGKVADTRAHYRRVASIAREGAGGASGAKLEDLFSDVQIGEAAKLELIIRADTHGSLEALADSLAGLERPEVKINFLHKAVGPPAESDVTLAQAAGATIIAFNTRPDRGVRAIADQEGVEIRTYEIIYKVIEDIEAAVIGMLEPEFKEVVTGEAEVREVFKTKSAGNVAGCLVQSGVITRNDKVRFLRNGTVIWHGTLTSLKRFTDDVTEVRAGFECGVGLSDFQELIPGDIIETYEDVEVPRT